jgi:hypothetical protein
MLRGGIHAFPDGMSEPEMSKLQDILLEAKQGLSPGERISERIWPAMAAQCGAAELEDIGKRVAHLEKEMATVDEWDGDTRDDTWRAIDMFRALADLITRQQP